MPSALWSARTGMSVSRMPPSSDGQGVEKPREALVASAAAGAHSVAVGDPSVPRPGGWIVLVAEGQDGLYEHLRDVFSADRGVEVCMDRAEGLRCHPSWVVDRLRTHGVAVVHRELL
jgi:hypothetical protein